MARSIERQAAVAAGWRTAVAKHAPRTFKPFVQSLYIDLASDPEEQPTPLHRGFRGGRNAVLQFLTALRSVGVNHVVLNLKYGRRDAGDVLEEIGMEVLPKLQSFTPAEVAKATS